MITIKALSGDSFQLSDGQVFPIPYTMSKDEKLKEAYLSSVIAMQNKLKNSKQP